MHFLQIVWDPKTVGIPITDNFTIHFYSMMWMLAFILGWILTKRIYVREGLSNDKMDSLFVYSVLGIMIGARLGHVLFYQRDLIIDDFFSIFLPFKFKGGFEFTGFRGLASHGAAIGMILAMYLYNKKVLKKSLVWILDRVVVAVALGAVFVRIGNFLNSEMIGEEATHVPWAIIFEQYDNVPRHPGQLYEAFGYVFVFLILWWLYWKTRKREQTGYLFGAFLVMLWSVRFVVEFFKLPQEGEDIAAALGNVLNNGQLLSIPFILIGLYFMFMYKPKPI